ncbi:type II toxin-antitoxin system HicA family toxin [Fibrobacter sp.]|jgi:predicted RNA binding protein YcfA (HicA-like mRNA interferase family)|uniref:type II toxin-antitoxin system HicA family toxin n=1 Tax=Fibrobacter sp. TaxID=35828 RepID=UPI00386610E3
MKFIEICKYAEDRGWVLNRINGSHYIYVKPGKRSVPVQKHSKEIEGVYLKRILKQFD